jgi:hypothetical protein
MHAKLALAVTVGLVALLRAEAPLAADSEVPTDFATIQAAIDDAATVASDTITVLGAHAEDSVVIDKAVTIAGNGIGSTVITLGAGTIGFRPEVDGITIMDMTIEGGSQAIRFEKALGTIDNTTIDGVEMLDQTSRGIEVHNATTVTNLLIDQSEFIDTNGVNSGIRVASSGHLDGVEFRDSTFDGNAIGYTSPTTVAARRRGRSSSPDRLFRTSPRVREPRSSSRNFRTR